MKVGIHCAFHSGSVPLTEFAVTCENLGFESLWLPEHTVIPVNPSLGPGGVPGAAIPDSYFLMVDPLIGLTVAAIATDQILLGTGVCLIPEHHPIDLAKKIASLDFYSNGRFILGAGAGWQPEESIALGGDFEHRWTQTQEAIVVMKKLWAEEEPEHQGHYYEFPPLRFHPKPVQQPAPPILLGGTSKRVFERIASWADGWAPWMISPEDVAAGRRQLDHACRKANRNPATTEVTVFCREPTPWDIKDYAIAGADRVVYTVPSTADLQPFKRLECIAGATRL